MTVLQNSLIVALLVASPLSAVDEEVARLRNAALAELENEQPAKAEDLLQQLADRVPDDPMPPANLAIAVLRQQRFDEALAQINQALAKAPDDPRVLAIRGEILQWQGRPDEALKDLLRAAAVAPQNVEIQYALLRQASTYPGDLTDQAIDDSLTRLVGLRPENLVVLLQSGQRALAKQDRRGATSAFLRVEEVVWQAPDAAAALLQQLLAALEAGDFEAARVPALRLENVLKITPMYKEGLRELSPGIQGIPIVRLSNEPEPESFGDPEEVEFRARLLQAAPAAGRGLTTGDFDGDQRSDWARITTRDGGSLEVTLATHPDSIAHSFPAVGTNGLLTADLDNDGFLDLIAFGPGALLVWRGDGSGDFSEATEIFGLQSAGATALAVLDFDIEGDLDLAGGGGKSGGGELFRNSLQGPLEPVGDKTLPKTEVGDVHDIVASDLDRDGDVDLLLAHGGGLTWLDNLRQGRFADRTADSGLGALTSAVHSVASVDLDDDGLPDIAAAGQGVRLLHNLGGRFSPWDLERSLRTSAEFRTLSVLDADNDGRHDLAAAGPGGLVVLQRDPARGFTFLVTKDPPSGVLGIRAVDIDGDCDLDLLTTGSSGLHLLENSGTETNRCLAVRLRGLNKGNSKNNLFGFGSTLEIRAGNAYQFREVDSDVTHLGVGSERQIDLLRVVWTNGVPQNRLQPESNQRIVEEQVLKGSCPFVYAWNGDEIEFVTDLLWGAPAGLPIAPEIWASADASELVELPNAESEGGEYHLRVTEELWEAAYFDLIRLWVVDHPEDVEVASSLRIVPGEETDERVLASRRLRSVTAYDSEGREVSSLVATRDEIYASPWVESPYQGVASEPWALILDLGEAPASAIRLQMDAWIFPTDASLNLALAQRGDLNVSPPRLEVETAAGWQVLMANTGFPAGKTKTMVIDTPALPAGARRLRLTGNQWIGFDRIAWTTDIADHSPSVRAKLSPSVADLRYRGFSRPFRISPKGPHHFDYSLVEKSSPWLAFPGIYTRYGDVRELLDSPDDRSVVLAPGDEIALVFDASLIPPLRPGWRRTVFLESHGWDKDADRNTWSAQSNEPLPFRAMSGYPFAEGESFPRTPELEEYRRTWLTRVVEPEAGILPSP